MEAVVVEEGTRVRLRADSAVVAGHPELRDVVGVVGSIMRGGSLTEPQTTMHVRFRDLGVVALSVPVDDVEPVDHLSPELRVL